MVMSKPCGDIRDEEMTSMIWRTTPEFRCDGPVCSAALLCYPRCLTAKIDPFRCFWFVFTKALLAMWSWLFLLQKNTQHQKLSLSNCEAPPHVLTYSDENNIKQLWPIERSIQTHWSNQWTPNTRWGKRGPRTSSNVRTWIKSSWRRGAMKRRSDVRKPGAAALAVVRLFLWSRFMCSIWDLRIFLGPNDPVELSEWNCDTMWVCLTSPAWIKAF